MTLALPTLALADDKSAVLDEVVVTVPAMAEPLTVVTDPKAPRQPVPAHDGSDYLKNIPGFSAIRKGGADGDPVLRGLAGSRLNVIMDGQYIQGGCGMRMDPPTAYVFPEVYDRVTVLKGPQTVVHGGGNLAGTALFERDTRPFETAGVRGYAGLLAGSFNRNDQVVDVTGGGRPGFVRFTGTRSAMNDYQDGDGRDVHSAYTRWNAGLVGGWTPDPDTRLELNVDRSDGEARYADRGMDGVLFDRTGYGLKYAKQNLSPLVQKFEAQVYHNYVDHVMDNYSLRTKTASMYMISNPDRATDGARVLGGLAATTSTALTLGVDYQQNKHTLRTASNMAAPPNINAVARTPDMTFRNVGVFTETDTALNARNRLVAGLRLDQLGVDNEKTTGSGALSSDTDRTWGAFVRHEHALSSSLTTFLGIGHAERPADWWERSTYNDFYLEPEKSSQLDTGIVYAGGAWRAGVSAFYARIDDFILTRNDNTVRNVDATTYGIEADAAYALGGPWKLTGTLAWMRGENDTDDVPLAQTPPPEARFGLGYDDRIWSFGVLARIVATQDRVHVGYGSIVGQDIGATPGFTVYSLNAGWRPRKSVLITAGIDNVTDVAYAEHLSRAGAAVAGYVQTTRVNEPGRSYWLKGSVTF
jgi:iron complex outermembrane receptor protein